MFELNQVGENSYYINCPAKIGIYKINDTEVYLIDSGNDKDAGKKIHKILDSNGWKLKGIINTHSNADHIGGNRYLQQQTDCKIFAKGIEADFTKHPILEPSFLYGGYPCEELRHKFLLAAESEVLDITDNDFPKELEVISLSGHFFDMIGVRTPDDVVFLADCISSKKTLDKYQIAFIYDVEEYLKTLDKVETIDADMFVPAHADAMKYISELVQLNREKVFEIADKIKSILQVPMCFEQLLKILFDEYNLTMNFEQYVLVGSTVRSYLSWLKDNGQVDVKFENNLLLWKTV
ncbi:MAG: MBL fold metallo-hydrolase [Acetobacter sp.]|nr:MBL fold metallo-hydrolase [Bacteroides sp.]MCM1341035.1 MBL fold metallo-hydrolase [Acetobacter sp.]MCM1432409.1 MBL fold metallo-hydrolase [Clostridiales bacterium]